MYSDQRTQGCRARARTRVRASRFIAGVAAIAALVGAAAPASVSHAATDDSAIASQSDSQSTPEATPEAASQLPIARIEDFPEEADPNKPFATVPVGTRFLFDGSSSSYPTPPWDGYIRYFWFSSDDRSTSDGARYEKIFNRPGIVKVTLRVTDRNANTDDQSAYFNVVEKMDARVSIYDYENTNQRDRTVTVGTRTLWWTSISNVDPKKHLYSFWWSTDEPIAFPAIALGPATTDRTFEKTFDVPGTFYLYAQDYIDYGSGGSAVARIIVTKPDGSHVPEVKLVPAVDQRVLVGQRIAIDASQSIDLDGDRLSFEWALNGYRVVENGPSITRTFEKPGWNTFEVRVSDGKGNVTTATRKIYVELPQRPPVAAFTPADNPTVAVGSTLTFDGTPSTDPDNQPLTYKWTTDDSDQTSTDAKFTPKFTKPGKVRVTLKVTDPDDLSSEYSTTVNVTSANEPPVANFSVPSSIVSGQQVAFDGSSSKDPDGDELTFEWRVRYATGVMGKFKVLNYTFPKAGTYGVELTVTDPSGASSKKWVAVTVTSVNEAPVAKFTVPPKIAAGTAVDFDGSASSDPDGDALTYEWRVRYANGVVGKSKVLNYKFPKAGKYGVQLTVTDPSGASSVKWVEVTVTSTNKAPVANFKVPSSIAAGTPVDIDGSSSSDPDGDALTYEWRVRYAKGVVGKAKVLNYKFPKAGKYGVQLTVTDPSGASSKKWVEVTVN